MTILTFTGLGATPVLAYSGRGRVTIAGSGRLCDAAGTTTWNLSATPLVLELREATDVYVNGTGAGTASLIVTAW